MSTFAAVIAINADKTQAAPGTVGQVFAPTDTGATTPLAIFDLNGIPISGNELVVNAEGIIDWFRYDGLLVVDWVSGDFRIPIPCVDQLPAGGTTGQVLAKTSGADYDAEWVDPPISSGGGGGGTPVIPPIVWQQTARSQTILSLRSLFGGLPATGDANLMEARNSVASGTPDVGQLVWYLNEEAFPRIQNALNSKTLFRIRNWGVGVNAIQVTDSGGAAVLFNVRADDGFVTAPNIGEPIRGVLAAGAQPAPGAVEGIYLRRLT
ncbi:hypothetical protein [Arthrobacter sp. HY1533]|uniref:hypothetical protein n=1 Tax=Arthrobacter sp. HY1533 TaxID=2970919 RepID=UPI0022B9F334|nr:hypothetical protein [Arthrobacter sp. HY1533]